MMRDRWTLSAGALLVAVVGGHALGAAQRDGKGRWVGVLDEHPAIEYATRPTADPVARLNQALEAGTESLTFEPGSGYLRSVLRALDVPAASQMLVLSRTGVQRHVTSPTNPRALYFNETVAVGFIRGSSFLEFAAQDPEQGVVFYTLDQRAADRPLLSRQTSCLSCHVTTATMEVPGFVTRSLAARPDGTPSLRFDARNPDHRLPFQDRWGGWYVTGAPAALRHRGNVVTGHDDELESLVPGGPLGVASLDGALDLASYASTGSDVLGLALFDHQARAANLVTRLSWEARVAEHEGFAPGPDITALVGELAAYLTFVDEAPMPVPLAHNAPLTAWFTTRGPTGSGGKSLRTLDLRTRLLRYPLSYAIYGAAFDALPDAIRGAVYRAIEDLLDGRTAPDRLARIGRADRRAALEILRETKPDAKRWLDASAR